MFKKIKSVIDSIKISLNERIQKRLHIEELRAEENLRHLKNQAVCEYLASRPAYKPARTIANTPKVEIKKVA